MKKSKKKQIAQTVGVVEYTEFFSAEVKTPPSFLDITLNNLILRLQ